MAWDESPMYRGGLLGLDPQSLALLQAGMGLLSAAGPSPQPIGFGPALAQGIQGYSNGLLQANEWQQQQQEMQRRQRQDALQERLYGLREKELNASLEQQAQQQRLQGNLQAMLSTQPIQGNRPTPAYSGGGLLGNIDPQTRQVAGLLAGYDPVAAIKMLAPEESVGDPFTLNPGDVRFSPTGEVLASLPALPKEGPAAPSGYRWTDTGGLAPIPGGPADPANAGGDQRSRQISEYQRLYNVDEATAVKLADGLAQIGVDPITGQSFIADKVSGTRVPLEGQGPPLTKESRQNLTTQVTAGEQFVRTLDGALAKLEAPSGDTTVAGRALGVRGTWNTFLSGLPAQVFTELADPEVTDARTWLAAIEREAIRATSVNPERPSVYEQQRIRSMMPGFGPGESASSALQKLRTLGDFVKAQNAIAAQALTGTASATETAPKAGSTMIYNPETDTLEPAP